MGAAHLYCLSGCPRAYKIGSVTKGWFYLELVYEIRNKGCDKVSLARLYTAPAEIKRRGPSKRVRFAVRF